MRIRESAPFIVQEECDRASSNAHSVASVWNGQYKKMRRSETAESGRRATTWRTEPMLSASR